MMRSGLLGVCAVLLVTGCASVSREECLAGDWVAIGARDGAAGRVGEVQFDRHVQACARVDVTPDRTAWAQGYAEGLGQYCTARVGLREGEAGRPYRGVCPVASEAAFLRGHDLGRSAWQQQQRINALEQEVNALAPASAGLGDDEAARRQWAANQAEASILRLQILAAQTELARIRREIRAFRATL